MISRRDDPFPFEAVRDLLGLMRAIYAARKGGTLFEVECLDGETASDLK